MSLRPFPPFRPSLIASAISIVLALSGCANDSNLSAEEYLERAKDMQADGDLSGMVIQLKNAIQKSPDNPQARLMLGEAYLGFKQSDSAIKELSLARELGVGEARIKPLIGEALIQSKDYQRVLDEIQMTDAESPRNRAQITQLRADALLGLRKYAEACALYEQSSQIDPLWHKALLGVAICEHAQGDARAARAALVKATAIAPASAGAWISLAKLERTENRPVEARKALDNALRANNANLDALAERAALLISLNDFKGATKDAERMRSIYPKHYLGDYVLALIAFSEKKIDVAREHIQRSQQTAPAYLPGVLLSGAIEYSLGNMGTAEAKLNRVLQSSPDHPYASRLLAAAQLSQGRVEEAARTLGKADPDRSDDVAIRVLAGELALAKTQYEVASRHFEKAVALQPDDPSIRTQLARARLAQGDPRAADDLRAASAMDPEWQGADRALIIDQIQKRQFDAALQSIAALEKKAPKSPQPWNLRGVVYLSQHDFPKARESFAQALKRDPTHFPSAANLAEMDLRDGRPDDARGRFESILKADKKNVHAMMALAGLAERDGNPKEQLARLEQANKTAPAALLPLLGLSHFHLGRGDQTRALSHARAAVDAYPDNPEALAQLGRVQAVFGDAVNALSTYKKLADMQPNSADALLGLAVTQIANKQAAAGRATLQRALALEPTHFKAQAVLLNLNLTERKFEAALAIARELQKQYPKLPAGHELEGDVYMRQGQHARATPAYEQALTLGKSSPGFVKLARALHFSGQTQNLDRQLAAQFAAQPGDLLIRAYAAEYFMATERLPQAIAHYEFLTKRLPDRADYLNNLATLYQRVNDGRALATAERALKLAPDSPGIQDTLGWILVDKGDVAAGLTWLKKAVSGAPKVATIRYHYAAALAGSGNAAQAKKELQSLLATQKGFPEADAARKLLASL